jgi:hypothetical protein
VAALAGGLACGGTSTGASSGAGPPPGGRHVLFVGNSLTYYNQMPYMVEALAGATGGERLTVEVVAFPDYDLGLHLEEGTARRLIARGGWDVVVLQQGPSALPESRDSLRAWTRRFAAEIRAAGARPALYMVWPSADRVAAFDSVRESYALAAADVDGLFIPAGEAWRAAWRRDGSVALYAPDGLHPTPAASYLAAIAIYGVLSGRSPVGLPSSLRLRTGAALTVPPQLAALLQEAAAEANARYAVP